MTAYQLLLNAGEVSVPAGPASLVVNVSPLFTAILAVTLLGEHLSVRGRAGIAVGFGGRHSSRCRAAAVSASTRGRCSSSAPRSRGRRSSSRRRACSSARASRHST